MRLVPVALAVLFAGSAHAWSQRTADHDLAPQLVRGKLEGPIASLTARFVIPVEARQYAQAFGGIALPPLGIVTGATVRLNGAEHVLALEAAETASQKFDALGMDEEKPGEKRSAVMISGEPGAVTLSVATAHGGVLALELSVSVPTCFAADLRYAAVPASWVKVSELALRGRRVKAEQIDAACATAVQTHRGSTGNEEWIAFPAPEVAKRPSGERIGAFAGRLALGPEHLARVELDLAARLSEVPRDLATVILVDASRSMSADDLEAQRQLVGSYLRAAPDSRVQVLAYARRSRALLPGWTTASQAAARVDRELRAIAPRNGSHFDAALADAASWLERTGGTRRVVLVTDERMSERLSALSPATLKRVLPAGTLVHVIALGGGGQQPVRDEEAHLAPLAAATDGMAVRAGHVEDPANLDATLLVRPISLDFVTVKAPGWTQITPRSDSSCGDQTDVMMPEGASCTWWGEGDPSSGPIVIEGLVWGRRTQRLVQPDAQRGTDVARELSALGSLDERLQRRVDFAARGVNSTWSLYTQWGGSEGYALGFGFGMSGIGGGGCGCGGVLDTFGRGSGTGGYHEPPDLARQLRPLLSACRVETVDIRAKLELTYLEIAELAVELSPPAGTSAAQKRAWQQCVEDALWDAQPALTHVAAHQTFDVELRATK